MHIPDGFVSGPVNIAGAVVAAGAVAISTWRASREAESQPHTVPLLATTGAFVFAAQMLNFPIGGGTSGHFLGAAAVTALLGPWRAPLVIALVVTLQALMFSDGGLTALGTNICNMAVIGCGSSYVVMRAVRAMFREGPVGYAAAAAIAGWVSVLCAAAACALELAVSGTSPLSVVLPLMVGTHVVIGIGEALITVAVLSAVTASRPDIVPAWAAVARAGNDSPPRRPARRLAAIGLLLAVVLAGLASPFASSFPDGLERSMERSGIHQPIEHVPPWFEAPLPDYAVPGLETEPVSTGLAGILGTATVFLLGFVMVKWLGRRAVKAES